MANFFAALSGIFGAVAGWILLRLALVSSLVASNDPSKSAVAPETILFMGGALGALLGMITTIALILHVRGSCRSPRELAHRTATLVMILVVLSIGALGLRASLRDHLGLVSTAPMVEFEIRLPKAVAERASHREVQVELRSDVNQALAQLRDDWRPAANDHVIVTGRVAIDVRSAQRFVVFNIPGEPARLFKLRLAQNPSRSGEFGPWFQVDFVDGFGRDRPRRADPVDAFAIRYRVI